jgi:leucyl aminopeptidase
MEKNMQNNFTITTSFKKNKIDIYIFVIFDNFKKNIDNIKTLFNIKDIPNKFLNNEEHGFLKSLYTDKSEIIIYKVKKTINCNNSLLFNIYGKLGKLISERNGKQNIMIKLSTDDVNIIKNQVISYILGFYNFTKFKTNTDINKSITYFWTKKKYVSFVEEAIYIGNTQNELRSLINTPANILTSKVYAKYIKDHVNKSVKVVILNEKQLKKLGCNLILGVNQGSKNEAKMVLLEYGKKNKKNNNTVAIIGKGVMFDSGGLDIKSGDFSDMKNDMAGSAIVYGLFNLLSKNKVSGHFIGLLPLVENMVDANSIRPGDILKAYNGKTVEIIDTDAEGRLIMADALSYSNNYKPKICIDIATLTGQASAIFGNKSSVIIGNNNKYTQLMINAGLKNNEKIWELPMWEEYVSLTKSNIADYKNYSKESRAGTIMAGAFLSNFIPKNTNWIHLDIAGVDTLSYQTVMRNYGASAEILRSVFNFLNCI